MLCKICGSQIPDDSKECEFCGAKLSEELGVSDETKQIDTEEIKNIETESDVEIETDDEEEIYDDNERRRREQVQKMLDDKKQQLSEIERRRNEKRQKQKRNRILLIGGICALAVAATGIGIYYVAQNINGGDNITETPAPTTVMSTPSVIATVAPSAMPSPDLSMTTSPREESSSTNEGQSWSVSGGSNSSSNNSSSSTGGRGTSSSNTSSSSSNSSSNSGSSSSGTTSASSGTSSSSNSSSSSSGNSNGGTASVTNSGVSSSKISAQLSKGGEVIYNTGTGKYLMTFVTGNKKYYANVSSGSTTAQIQNNNYTITAEPTGETYNGNTVYEITSITNYAGKDYILAKSGIQLLTNDDIKGMSKHDLALARNEIYARHGRKFQTEEYNTYFSGKSWYQINPNYNYSDDDSNLNSIEVKNIQFILSAERK